MKLFKFSKKSEIPEVKVVVPFKEQAKIVAGFFKWVFLLLTVVYLGLSLGKDLRIIKISASVNYSSDGLLKPVVEASNK